MTTITDYKTVFQLAQNKGYDSILAMFARYGGDAALPHEITGNAMRLCELTLIQKWLRDEHGVDIEIHNQYTNAKEGKWYYPALFSQQLNYQFGRKVLSTNQNTSYESALLNGINEALKLIP